MDPAFSEVLDALKALERGERYEGAFVFGSFARGDATAASDVDVKVVVTEDNPCPNINHPFIAGRKLDLSFLSLAQLEHQTEDEIARRERVPMVAESVIVFDKTGDLARLRDHAQQVRPRPFDQSRTQLVQFLVYHANNKVERHLDADPLAALLVMHVSLYDVLTFHYEIAGRWRLSDKRLLGDLRNWDAPLAALVEQLVSTGDAQAKYAHWSRIVDHVLTPLGGRQPINENNCACDECRADLAALLQP
jgi:predicted nucleotidyltransferase